MRRLLILATLIPVLASCAHQPGTGPLAPHEDPTMTGFDKARAGQILTFGNVRLDSRLTVPATVLSVSLVNPTAGFRIVRWSVASGTAYTQYAYPGAMRLLPGRVVPPRSHVAIVMQVAVPAPGWYRCGGVDVTYRVNGVVYRDRWPTSLGVREVS